MRKGIVVLALACVLAPQASGGSLPLPTRLANALAVRGNRSDASGAVALDLRSGKVVFARHGDLPLAPASNEKLTVTYAALEELGPDYRFSTEVLGNGEQTGSTWHGNVYLRGYGDPTLDSLQLDRLATQLSQLGIRRIDGRILGDESWFDAKRTAPGWKAEFYINECPPLSALVANRAVYQGHVARMPAIAAAGVFRTRLRAHGIASGPVGAGVAPASADVLAIVRSKPLPAILEEMDETSDNFVAEMLLKDLGRQAGTAGTTAAGAAVVRHVLAAAGIPLAGVRIVDGSGLSLLDRLTANTVVALLDRAWSDPAMQHWVWAALPVAGQTGTLEDRMDAGPAYGMVRAKTGTTDDASALSGYVGDRYVFAILQNGSPVSATAAREAQDRFATALASAAGQ